MSTELHVEVTEAMVRLIKNLWDDGFGYSHEGIVQDLRRNVGVAVSIERVRMIYTTQDSLHLPPGTHVLTQWPQVRRLPAPGSG